ncbi:uncharacterized protein LOC135566964 [Oncorhynchus nerka]|uniref:uncharacterized protein LOC135566964 n=1 Tax=Oncorhynchus nerka TaxID=8023 RepID=UPI0031B817FE
MAMVMRDCIIPRTPRQHYCSYGQIPLPPPFCFLSETSPLPSPTDTTSYVFLCDSGRRRFSLAQSDSLLTRMRSVASDELNQMMQRRMSQENPIRASETEFIQRLQRLVVLAVNRLIYHDVSQDFYDLLNFPDSPDHHLTPDPVDHAPRGGRLHPWLIRPHPWPALSPPLPPSPGQHEEFPERHPQTDDGRDQDQSGQYGPWWGPQAAVEEDPVVMSGHLQGSDRTSLGAHPLPCITPQGQEGGSRVCVRPCKP